jgi:CRP-like cAMP-binding protein
MDMTALEREIERLAAPLKPSERVKTVFRASLSQRSVDKGGHLFREGEIAQGLFFIRSGLVRYYYLVDGVEHTGQFFSEGAFLADVFALTTGAPGLQNIDALEPSDVIVIPRPALVAAFEADHAYERFGRRMMEEAMAGSQRRTASLLKLSAEERYERFVSTRPEIARRIPQYLIASYLGVTPEGLSRIRRRRVSGSGGAS